jgi:hypothetical protein
MALVINKLVIVDNNHSVMWRNSIYDSLGKVSEKNVRQHFRLP